MNILMNLFDLDKPISFQENEIPVEKEINKLDKRNLQTDRWTDRRQTDKQTGSSTYWWFRKKIL